MTKKQPPKPLTMKRCSKAKTTGRWERHWCSRTAGFVLIVSPRGAMNLYWQRQRDGKLHKIRLADFRKIQEAVEARLGARGKTAEKLTPEFEAIRDMARRCNDVLRAGGNPKTALHGDPTVMTISEAWELFKPDSGWSARTLRENGYLWSRHIEPVIGDRPLDSISGAEIAALLARAAKKRQIQDGDQSRAVGGSVASNRARAALSALFSWAVERGMVSENTVTKVKPRKERPRDRTLEPDEVEKILEALEKSPSKDFADVVKLLVLTGCRSGEVLGLRWSEITLGGSSPRLTIHRDRTKGRMTRKVPLVAEAVAVLEGREQGEPGDHVFPSSSESGHLGSVRKGWANLIKRAEIEGATPHDLRRTVAQSCLDAGADYAVVSAMLGHSPARLGITSVYAQPSLDRQRAALEAGVSRLLGKAQAAEVVAFERAGSEG